MTKPVNLNVERARAARDCRLQTPQDVLEDATAEAPEAGWTKAILILCREEDDGTFMTHLRFAGMTSLETRGLLLTAIRSDVLDD